MFTTKHNECVGFESRWKVIKVSQESATETTEFSTSNQQCTTKETRNCDTQTEPQEQQLESQTEQGVNEEYMQRLSKWLNEIYPQVKNVMDDVSNSKAFEGYRLSSDDTELNCKLVQTLTLPLPKDANQILNDSDENDDKSKVNLLIWNCTGSILAAAMSKNHHNWCCHLSTVFLYYRSTKNGDQIIEGTPRKLNFSSCVVAIRFHVNQPTILAAATFSGELYVCSVAKSTESEVMVKIQAHNDPITHLMWIPDLNSKNEKKSMAIMTSGTDGCLKMFSTNLSASSNEDKLKLRAIYKIQPPLFNKFNRPQRKISQNSISCFDFSKLAPELFVVALEGARLVQCSLLGAAQLSGNTFDPVVRHFTTASDTEIVQVCFSQTRADIFAALGADGAVRLFVVNQEDVAQVVHPQEGLSAISWVAHVDKVIIGCGGRSHKLKGAALRLFDVTKAEELDMQMTTSNDVKDELIMLAVSQSSGGRIVVTSDTRGRLQLWQIPWQLL